MKTPSKIRNSILYLKYHFMETNAIEHNIFFNFVHDEQNYSLNRQLRYKTTVDLLLSTRLITSYSGRLIL